MEVLSKEEEEILLKIYIGQNIRDEGILVSDIREENIAQRFLEKELIKRNRWYSLDLYLVTEKARKMCENLISERILMQETIIHNDFLNKIPGRFLNFLIVRYISDNLFFSTKQPDWIDNWPDLFLKKSADVWKNYRMLFNILIEHKLCVSVHYYVSTRKGEKREYCYVISPEIKIFLEKKYGRINLSQSQLEQIEIGFILHQTVDLFKSSNILYIQEKYLDLFSYRDIPENKINAIVDETSKLGLTSEYKGINGSTNRPFEIINAVGFLKYIDENFFSPILQYLKSTDKFIESPRKIIERNDERIIEKGEFLTLKEKCDFFKENIDFENDLREFLKMKLGPTWFERLKKEHKMIIDEWDRKKDKDERFGFETENDMMKYSGFGDYKEIIEGYKKIFSGSDDAIPILKVWYYNGRNPMMHGRMITKEKFESANYAIKFLRNWIARNLPNN